MDTNLGKFGQNKKQDAQQDKTQDETPDVRSLGQSTEIADALCTASFTKTVKKLGAHRMHSEVSYAFHSAENGVRLSEKALIVWAQNGDFRVTVNNSAGQGYELIFAEKRFFLRSRYAAFNERSVLDGQHLALVDQAAGAWAAIYRLFRGQFAFSKLGQTRHFGRKAIAYRIRLSSKSPHLPGTPEPPEVPEGVTKYVYEIEKTPADLDRWRDLAKPENAKGRMVVDLSSGAILKVEFSGKLSWSSKSQGESSVEVKASIQSDGFGNPASIQLPDEKSIQPLPERIQVDTHPLDFHFGKGYTSKLGPPAGVAADKHAADQPAADQQQ